jgi:putative ABC transport system permease protein
VKYKPEPNEDGTVPRPVPDTPVRTGAEVRDAEVEAAIADIDELFAVVGMFLAIAIGAAVLVAVSTFRIVFAQRMRQLALLRAVGAGRAALVRALITEGALTGLVAGTVGMLAAVGTGLLAPQVAAAFDREVLTPAAPVLPLAFVVLGTVFVAIMSVLAPAFTASRVAPLEALRAASVQGGRSGIGWFRAGFGVLTVIGAGLLLAGAVSQLSHVDDKSYDPTVPMLMIIGSGGLAYVALVALGPVLLRPVLAFVGWPLRRLGPLGRLAVGGVGGAPRRAAAVSVVVALGVTLVAAALVGGASMRALAEQELALEAPADFVVTAEKGSPLPAGTVDRARGTKDVTRVLPYRTAAVDIDGTTDPQSQKPWQTEVIDVDLKALKVYPQMRAAEGSLGDIGPGKAAVVKYLAHKVGVGVGGTMTFRKDGKAMTVTVVALVERGPLDAGVLTDPGTMNSLGIAAEPNAFTADQAREGAEARNAARKSLRAVGGAEASLSVSLLADQRDDLDEAVNSIMLVLLGLVGLTVIIAVVGVGSTTALSVVERVREAGRLRAVGMSRTGLRVMLTTEASLYGIVGAAMGLALAVPYSWLAISSIGHGVPVEMPIGQLALVVLVLAALTALAGVLPARRAAKTSPVVALATDG